MFLSARNKNYRKRSVCPQVSEFPGVRIAGPCTISSFLGRMLRRERNRAFSKERKQVAMPDSIEYMHNVFISWSGPRSKHVAEALRGWLPMVLHVAKPWMSKSDIDKGSRGLLELAKALEQTKVGVVCLTAENLSAKWILFESGALSKTLDRGTRLCTFLLGGLRPENVEQPLGAFQATMAEKEETRKLIQDIGKTLDSPVVGPTLDGVFEALWPTLEEKLASMPREQSSALPERSLEDMVAEILKLTRLTAREGQVRSLQIMLGREHALLDGLLEPTPHRNGPPPKSWTKPAPSGKLVTYEIEKIPDNGWVYSATPWGTEGASLPAINKKFSRKQVERLFANYIAEV
jgi:hypothetical protein